MDREKLFMKKVNIDAASGCWLWTGATTSKKVPRQYGVFWDKGRNILAHRWSYEHWVGPIPEGLVLDHIECEVYLCVNYTHVVPTTRGLNTLRSTTGITALNKAKTHCLKGHPLSGVNLYVDPRGTRKCRECQRARVRDHYNRNKEALRASNLARYHRRKGELEISMVGI